MRHIFPIIFLGTLGLLNAQETKVSPTEELRITVKQWVDTMRQIQEAENEWASDQEVLANYKEGLEKEIVDLKEKIADAKTRKEGASSESLKHSAERDRYIAATGALANELRVLEESMAEKLPMIPPPLRAEPKVKQAIEDLERDLKLPEDKRNADVSKRLLNLINLTADVEKFQQTVVLRQELHKDSKGNESNMQVLYFGLAVAYAVNKEGSFALIGKPSGKDGWKFEEKTELAGEILNLIACTSGDQDPAFISLPFFQ